MKKIFLTIVFAAMALATAAQDTVRYPDPWYGYTNRDALWEYTGPDTTKYPLVLYDTLDDRYLIDTTTEDPILFLDYYHGFSYDYLTDSMFQHIILPISPSIRTLYGIALTMDTMKPESLMMELAVYRGVHLVRDTCWGTSLPTVFNASSLDSVYRLDVSDAPLMKQCTFEYDYSLPTQWSLYSNCYEFYFDEPMDMRGTDTAYIGISPASPSAPRHFHIGRDTSRSQIWYYTLIDLRHYAYCESEFTLYSNSILYGQDIAPRPYYTYDVVQGDHISDTLTLSNAYWNDCYWGGIFPIVQPRCTAPRGLRMAQGDRRDTAVWRGDNDADLFQLSFCPDSLTIPDSGSLVTLDSTRFPLPNLPHPDTSYVVYLRKMCTFAFNTGHTDTVWSAWSAPLLVDSATAGGHYGLEGIADIESSKLQVDITPNPASGMVEVRCSEPMALLELFNAAGDKVFSQQLSTFNFQFSIFNFPSGAYLVRITTPQGVTTRKLVKR